MHSGVSILNKIEAQSYDVVVQFLRPRTYRQT